ncbi:MAG: DUF2244 domain-containing protein [Alphaproteobacteria bacterium]|nr:DUF2244 domain-containing protein [Alphaproteobacteria bacterium]
MTSVPTIARPAPGARPSYSAILRPHRSMNRQGFLVLMAAISVVSFVAGIAFWMIGAWPVFGFFGLDVLLIYWAFKVNYAQVRNYESIELFPDTLVIRRVEGRRAPKEWRLQPYWVRVELEINEDLETCGPLWLTSHGKRLQLGAFLGPDQLETLAGELRTALARTR